jgi:deoxyribonuclease-4
MKRVGAHVPTTGGVWTAPENAAVIGAKAFALFTKNQRQWTAPPLDSGAIERFRAAMEKHRFPPRHVLPHDSYLINIGHPDPETRKKSYAAFLDELKRCEALGLLFLNIHPGNSLGAISPEQCMANIARCINMALGQTKAVTVVLETTAGQGTSVGYRFEHLAAIIDQVEDKTRAGVCFDTCHVHAAGYDLRKKKEYEATIRRFDSVVGLKYLKALHLNDAKSEFASRVDRHNSLGLGTIGLDAFRFIMNDPRFDEMPLILETIDEGMWKKEIKMLYGFVKKGK